MKLSPISLAIIGIVPCSSLTSQSYLSSLSVSIPSEGTVIYDPLGLYPKDSPDRTRCEPLEANESITNRPLVDPLGLYPKGRTIESSADMSLSLPFISRPQHLDGTMVGDVGFDPLGLASAGDEQLRFMRRAELKHARIAMLAAVGWPLAELIHTKLAYAYDVRPLLMYGDRVPSVLNGGLLHAIGPFWPMMVGALTLASVAEVFDEYYRGETNSDSFDYAEKVGENDKYLALAEIKNGRLAMMAVAAYAFQEAFTGIGIVPQMLAWTHPHSASFLLEEGLKSNVEAVLSGLF